MHIHTNLYVHTCVFLLVITVRFDSGTYIINEDAGILQPRLILSNPSSFNETVQVFITSITTNGKLSVIIHIK